MNPKGLLIDEPSIGLEPRYIDMVFEILDDLHRREGKTIVMVVQNAKKGLAFADIVYVLVAGRLALARRAADLLDSPDVGRLFLGGQKHGGPGGPRCWPDVADAALVHDLRQARIVLLLPLAGDAERKALLIVLARHRLDLVA